MGGQQYQGLGSYQEHAQTSVTEGTQSKTSPPMAVLMVPAFLGSACPMMPGASPFGALPLSHPTELDNLG